MVPSALVLQPFQESQVCRALNMPVILKPKSFKASQHIRQENMTSNSNLEPNQSCIAMRRSKLVTERCLTFSMQEL